MTAPNHTTSKVCTKCGEAKSLGEFYSEKGYYLSARCRPCSMVIWDERNRVRINANWAKRRASMGIGPDTQILDAEGRDWAWAYVVFRDIPEWPGYLFGSDGSVWSSRKSQSDTIRWSKLKLKPHNKGYWSCILTRGDGSNRTLLVHVMTLTAFMGPCPPGMETCHNNGIRSDGNIRNLRWDTRSNNNADKEAHGTLMRGKQIHGTILSEADIPFIRSLLASGLSCNAIGKRFGVSKTSIKAIAEGRTWRYVP